jgi:hypothetical protein
MPDSSRAAVRDVAVVLGSLVVLGALGGVLWSVVVTPAQLTRLPNGIAMNETALSAQFAADGWYAVIAVVAGLLAGVVLTWWRSRDALWTAALLVVGAVLAAVVMAVTGHLLGPPDPRHALLATKVGSKVPESLDLGVSSLSPFGPYLKQTVMFYLAWPVGALAGCLTVLLFTVPADRAAAEPAADHVGPPVPAEQGVQQSPAPGGTAD